NVIAAYDFDYKFLYAFVGYEGSINDRIVLGRAFKSGRFSVPKGRYYLANGSYLLLDKRLLVLY
ncbi:uncharacterized protein MYCFIDRAFT_37230, partial [Pseudocercospora fijiensis CIRAD86]